MNEKSCKSYADQRRGGKRSDIEIGECVRVKGEKQTRLSSQFDKMPFIVVHQNLSHVVAEDGNKRHITRTISHFKRIQHQHNSADSSDSDDAFDTDVAANRADEVLAPNEQQQQQQQDKNIP